MGDVQGKCQDDSEGKIESNLDPRDLIGPPDRSAIGRVVRSYNPVPPPLVPILATPPVLISADKANAKRRMSVFPVANQISGSPVTEGKDSGRRGTKSASASSSPVTGVGTSKGRWKSSVTQQSSSGLVDERSKKQATVNRPPVLLSKQQQRLENRIKPLSEAIRRGSPSARDLLVFEERDSRVRADQTSLDRSSPDSNGSDDVTTSGYRSGSSSSDAESLEPRPAGRWRQRWCIDKAGRDPGQIRCIRDLCMLRSGRIVATEPKNVRLQMFDKTGKSVAVLGPDTDSLRSSRSFGNPLKFRKMQPTGVVETVVDNLVAVTDLNRVLYIEAMPDGMLDEEVFLRDKTDLRGIASTRSSKLIITEVGSQPSVCLYETSGKFVREFKGNFRKPCYVAYDPIYDVSAISDCDMGLVFLYDGSGNLLTRFGATAKNSTGSQSSSMGSEPSAGDLVYPSGVCWSNHGRLIVADEVQRKVVSFDLRNLTAELLLTAEDGLHRPVAVTTDFKESRNRIYVAEELYDFEINKYYLKMFEQRMANF